MGQLHCHPRNKQYFLDVGFAERELQGDVRFQDVEQRFLQTMLDIQRGWSSKSAAAAERGYLELKREHETLKASYESLGQDTAKHLRTLGLDADAKWPDVERAYKQKARALHPDRGGDAEGFKRVQLAYDALRAAFDKVPPRAGLDPQDHVDHAAAQERIARMVQEDAKAEEVKEPPKKVPRLAKAKPPPAPPPAPAPPAAPPPAPTPQWEAAERSGLKVSPLLALVLEGKPIPLDTPDALVKKECQGLSNRWCQAKRKGKCQESIETLAAWSDAMQKAKVVFHAAKGADIEADVAEKSQRARDEYRRHRAKADYHARRADEVFERGLGLAASAAECAQARRA